MQSGRGAALHATSVSYLGSSEIRAMLQLGNRAAAGQLIPLWKVAVVEGGGPAISLVIPPLLAAVAYALDLLIVAIPKPDRLRLCIPLCDVRFFVVSLAAKLSATHFFKTATSIGSDSL